MFVTKSSLLLASWDVGIYSISPLGPDCMVLYMACVARLRSVIGLMNLYPKSSTLVLSNKALESLSVGASDCSSAETPDKRSRALILAIFLVSA